MFSTENTAITFVVLLVIQFLHSIEELSTGFHKKWYLFTMPFWVFLLFEILFLSFWACIWLIADFPNRTVLMYSFNILMLTNGVQHIIWQ